MMNRQIRIALLFGAEAILCASSAGEETVNVVSNAAWKAPSGTLSTMFQAGALIELSGDVETAFGNLRYPRAPAFEIRPAGSPHLAGGQKRMLLPGIMTRKGFLPIDGARRHIRLKTSRTPARISISRFCRHI